jgi:RNA polymerase sigma-70 factor (ECF subfamily)
MELIDGTAAGAGGEDEGARLRSAAGGDADAVRWLLDEVAPVVYGYLHARVGGDETAAADLLQETLLEAMRSAGGFRGEAAVTTWVCAIARHRLARHYERERRQEAARRGLTVLHGSTDEPEDASEGALAVDRRDEVVRALGSLTPLHRQVLVLKYLDGRSVEEIAGELGKGRVQVQSLLQRARAALRRALEGSDAG